MDSLTNTTSDYIDRTLEALVREYGLARVQSDLAALLPRARWADWQRLANIALNADHRIQREERV